MRRIRWFAVSLLASLALLSLATSMLLTSAAQDPVAGGALWAENLCKNCHGASGEGAWAWPLAGNQKTAEEWIGQVRSPRNIMPAFSDSQISDQVITDMNAFMVSLQQPEGFELSDAGLADDAPAGQLLIVEKKCVACHPFTRPFGGFAARGETPTAEAVITQLRTPRNRMPMFTADQVTDEDAGTIAAFLASQLSAESLPTTGVQQAPPSGCWLCCLLPGVYCSSD